MKRIGIVDNRRRDAERLALGIRRYWREHVGAVPEISFFQTGELFWEHSRREPFDLLFWDCSTERMKGIQTAGRFRKMDDQIPLILVADNRAYAIEGYLVGARGYLVKPIGEEQLENTLESVLLLHGKFRESMLLPTKPDPTRIFLEDIVHCNVSGHYVYVYDCKGRTLRARMSFLELCGKLELHPDFMESYRGCLVNLSHVERVEELDFVMDSGERIPFRKKERRKLLHLYSEYVYDKVRE